MDALSALSIAGTITQFVSFTASLISQASELHGSTNTSTTQVLNVDSTYSTLLEFNFGLKNASRDLLDQDRNSEARKLLELVAQCQSDCEKLLNITQTLKSEHQHLTWFQCMRKAIESAWNLPEIRLLDERLQRTQLTLVLIISTISRSDTDHIIVRESEKQQTNFLTVSFNSFSNNVSQSCNKTAGCIDSTKTANLLSSGISCCLSNPK